MVTDSTILFFGLAGAMILLAMLVAFFAGAIVGVAIYKTGRADEAKNLGSDH